MTYIDFKHYSNDELREAMSSIDPVAYPENHKRLVAEIEDRKESFAVSEEATIDDNNTEQYLCPNCNAILSKRTINRLRYLVLGVRPVKCEKCENLIQWSQQVRKKLIYLGAITNLGIILGTYSFLGWLGYVPVFGNYDHMLGTSLILIGITSTSSATKNAKVVLANRT